MNFLLDTNICSAYLRDEPRVFNRFVQYGGTLAISTIVVGELFVWVLRRGKDSLIFQGMEGLLGHLTVLPYDLACAARFGEVRLALFARGLASSPVDLMIAATALVHDLTLVTGNTHHFQHVPGLRLQNWLT